jgi:hypothetical protein
MKTKFALLIFLTFCISISFSQGLGRIEGFVFNGDDSVGIPNAQVKVVAGNKILRSFTNDKGYFIIKAIEPGVYSVEASFSGLASKTIEGVPVNSDITTNSGKFYLGLIELTETKVVAQRFARDLIQKDGGDIYTMESIELENMAQNTNIPAILSYMSSEFYVSDNTKEVHFRGSRDGMTAYFIDGIRVSSADGIPSEAIRSVTLYAGGVPAKYGDFLAGVVVIETKSYSEWVEERNKKEEYWKAIYELEQKEKEKANQPIIVAPEE